MRNLVEKLRAWRTEDQSTMVHWDNWRHAIADGCKASWPRDGFESLMSCQYELRDEAAAEIVSLRAQVETLTVKLDDARYQVAAGDRLRDAVSKSYLDPDVEDARDAYDASKTNPPRP